MRHGRAVGPTLVGLVVALSGCGADTLASGPDECPPGAACAAPTSALPTFERIPEPVPSETSPLDIAYQGPADSPDRILVRVEYPDLCQSLLGVHVVETADTVTLTAFGTPRADVCPLRLLVATGYVELDGPLGDRAVRVRGEA
jgi:hypothetical protein